MSGTAGDVHDGRNLSRPPSRTRAPAHRHGATPCTLSIRLYDVGRADEDGWVSPVWVVPDTVVAFGVGSHARSSYVVWREGKPPEFVMEYASVSTWRRDRDEKPARYESFGVREYFMTVLCMAVPPMGGTSPPPRKTASVWRPGCRRRK